MREFVNCQYSELAAFLFCLLLFIFCVAPFIKIDKSLTYRGDKTRENYQSHKNFSGGILNVWMDSQKRKSKSPQQK